MGKVESDQPITTHHTSTHCKSELPVLCVGMRGMCTKEPKSTANKPATPTPPPTRAPAPPAAPAFAYNSAATPNAPSQPVGPGADKGGAYPNTEYYTYNEMSYFDLEVEMAENRIKQPSADNGQF